MPFPPAFLRRAWRLHEAKRALLRGAAEDALEHLRDPLLALSPRADDLRARALDQLFRLAARRRAEGRDASAGRLVAAAALEDPERAARWGGLAAAFAPVTAAAAGPRAATAAPGAAPGVAGRAPRDPSRRGPGPRAPSTRLRAALGELCRSLARGDGGSAGAGARPARFHLAVDEGGELLVAVGPELVLGHARGGAADLPFLADVERRHARLVRRESFHGGFAWHLLPLGGARLSVAERPLAPDGARLADGDRVRLAPNLAFRFRTPDPASGSAVLELLHGAECAGAARVLWLAPGAAGRARIGSARRHHVAVADLEHAIELELDGAELVVRCAGGVRRAGAAAATREVRLACPPVAREDLALGARPADRAPFGCALRPLEGDEAGGGGPGGAR